MGNQKSTKRLLEDSFYRHYVKTAKHLFRHARNKMSIAFLVNYALPCSVTPEPRARFVGTSTQHLRSQDFPSKFGARAVESG